MIDKTVLKQVGGTAAGEHDMERIREILFGEQRRQTERQLTQIETRLHEQDSALRQLLEERIEQALEKSRRDLDALETQQSTAIDGLENALRALLQQADVRLARLDSDLQDTNDRLEQSAAEQRAALGRLQQDSTQRAQLAELLEGLARQLRTSPSK
jgi:chromosome segregation ATPase